MIVLNYPHLQPSLQPRRMRREAVWALGEAARLQVSGRGPRLKVEISQIVARSARLQINGLTFETHWELSQPVTDDEGKPVIGVTEHDSAWPNGAMIYLNGDLLREREDFARSTAVHELAHAVFDTPVWIRRVETSESCEDSVRRFRGGPPQSNSDDAVDWAEWRANEFMGAFLAPRALLHRHLHKRAAARGIAMVEGPDGQGLPVVSPDTDVAAVQELTYELAQMFGVSDAFMDVRLRKYGLIQRPLWDVFAF